MDYKKKSLNKINRSESYEEIDTRLASGWYVDTAGKNKKKNYKTKEVSFTISKKQKLWNFPYHLIDFKVLFWMFEYKTGTFF